MFTPTTRHVLAMLIATLLVLLCAQAMAEEITVYVATDGAPVYDASGIEIGTLEANTELKLTGVWDKLCRVVRDGKVAYMSKADLSRTQVGTAVAPDATTQPEATQNPEATAQPDEGSVTAYVKKDGASVYDAGGKVVGALDVNAQVVVTGIKGSVCRIS